jgi:hypothetical protein
MIIQVHPKRIKLYELIPDLDEVKRRMAATTVRTITGGKVVTTSTKNPNDKNDESNGK